MITNMSYQLLTQTILLNLQNYSGGTYYYHVTTEETEGQKGWENC